MGPFFPKWELAVWLLFALATRLGAGSPGSWGGSFMVGVSQWPGLETPVFPSDQLNPLARSRFNARGSNLEVALFREDGRAWGGMSYGGEFGVLWHECTTGSTYRNLSTGATIRSRAALNAGHLTGSLRVLRRGTHATFLLGAGVGLYMLVFKESFGGWVVETSSHSYAPGGFLAGGVEFHGLNRALAVRVEAQSHFVSFAGSALRGSRLEGPINAFRIGILLRAPG